MSVTDPSFSQSFCAKRRPTRRQVAWYTPTRWRRLSSRIVYGMENGSASDALQHATKGGDGSRVVELQAAVLADDPGRRRAVPERVVDHQVVVEQCGDVRERAVRHDQDVGHDQGVHRRERVRVEVQDRVQGVQIRKVGRRPARVHVQPDGHCRPRPDRVDQHDELVPRGAVADDAPLVGVAGAVPPPNVNGDVDRVGGELGQRRLGRRQVLATQLWARQVDRERVRVDVVDRRLPVDDVNGDAAGQVVAVDLAVAQVEEVDDAGGVGAPLDGVRDAAEHVRAARRRALDEVRHVPLHGGSQAAPQDRADHVHPIRERHRRVVVRRRPGDQQPVGRGGATVRRRLLVQDGPPDRVHRHDGGQR